MTTMISVDGIVRIRVEDENEKISTDNEEKSVELQSTRTLPPYKEPDLSQNGWQILRSPEGRIYFQNIITKTTQWTPPPHLQQDTAETEPFITMSDVSDNDRAKHIKIRNDLPQNEDKTTISIKEFVIWFIGFVLSIADFATDFQIVIVWFQMSSYCHQFSCYTYNDDSVYWLWAIILVLCSTIGFVAKLFFQYSDVKLFYASYKNMLTKDEFDAKKHHIWKLMLKYGWLPIVQDAVSIVLLNVTWWLGRVVSAISGLASLYVTSIVFSLLNIMLILFNTYRKKKQLVDLNLFSEIMNGYRVWCCCLCCCFVPLFTVLFFFLILTELSIHSWIYVDIIDHSNYTSTRPYRFDGDLSTATCPSYVPMSIKAAGQWTVSDHADASFVMSNDSFSGKIKESPAFIYHNCSGDDYNYSMKCTGHRGSDSHGINLRCMLHWEYNGNYSHCVNSEHDACGFHIDLGLCEDHVIECDDWEFFDGNPLMWACFQECTL